MATAKCLQGENCRAEMILDRPGSVSHTTVSG